MGVRSLEYALSTSKSINMAFPFLLIAGLLTTATLRGETGKDAIRIEGNWMLHVTLNADGVISNFGPVAFTVGDKEATWASRIPFLFEEKGKGTVNVEACRNPPTIELKVGDKVYKGIYRIRTDADGKGERLQILLGDVGGKFPKAFDDTRNGLPENFKGLMLYGTREK